MTPLPPASRQVSPASTYVDQGIALLQTLDRDLVATFLLRRGVRFPVIVRVLSEPHGRRRSAGTTTTTPSAAG